MKDPNEIKPATSDETCPPNCPDKTVFVMNEEPVGIKRHKTSLIGFERSIITVGSRSN